MGIPRNLRDLPREFAAAEVRYLVIGGYAQGFHAVPRFTKDVDSWLDPEPANVERALSALSELGAPRETIEAVKALSGLDEAWLGHAWSTRVTTQWKGVPAHIISRAWLLALKRASGRPQDLAGVMLLEQGEGS